MMRGSAEQGLAALSSCAPGSALGLGRSSRKACERAVEQARCALGGRACRPCCLCLRGGPLGGAWRPARWLDQTGSAYDREDVYECACVGMRMHAGLGTLTGPCVWVFVGRRLLALSIGLVPFGVFSFHRACMRFWEPVRLHGAWQGRVWARLPQEHTQPGCWVPVDPCNNDMQRTSPC